MTPPTPHLTAVPGSSGRTRAPVPHPARRPVRKAAGPAAAAARRLGLRRVVEDPRELRRAGLLAIGLLAVLNVADVLVTQLVVRRGGEEMNPLVRDLLESNGALGLKLAIVALLAVDFLFRRPRLVILCALWLVVGFYMAIITINIIGFMSL